MPNPSPSLPGRPSARTAARQGPGGSPAIQRRRNPGRKKSDAKISKPPCLEATRDTSNRLQRTAANAPDTRVAVLDEHGVILAVNRAWSDSQACGCAVTDFGQAGDNFLSGRQGSGPHHRLAEAIGTVLGGRTENVSLEYPCADAAGTRWHSARVTRLVEVDSPRIIVTCEDITQRNQEEAKRRWEQMFFQAQINSSLDGILVVDSQGRRKIFQNQRCVDLFGIPPHIADSNNDEGLLRWVLDLTEDPGSFLANVKHLYAHPKEKSRDEIALKDGRFLDRYSAPVLGEDGTLYGRIWTFRDITARKRMEESLRESEARFQRISDNMPGMVYRLVVQADGRMSFPFVSEGCRKIYGLDPQAVQTDARLLMDLIHPDDREEHDRSVAATVARLAPWNWQGRIRRADTGEIRHVQGASHPERQPNGDILWDGIVVDITENKRAEEDRRAKEEAERMNEAKSEFLSRMSHELRTPLNAVLGFGQVLEMSSLGTRDEQCVQYILKGGRHLLSLVDEVLDLTRVERGQVVLNLSVFPLEATIRDCVGLVSKMAQERGIICWAKGTASRVPVRADEQRLRQVLLNLLSNAIKYNREGGQVVISSRVTPDGKVRCQVEDTGGGISPQGLTRLFVPFERLGKELENTAGTGLGLVVSKRLAEAMGGTLGFRSQVNVGSAFWIDLPVAEAGDAHPAGEAPPALSAALPAGAALTTTVLYVEDNVSNLQLVQTAFERLRPNWRFLSATDGNAGLRLAREQQPGVVLLDLQIPGMAGDAVLRSLRAEPATARLPVLLLSADATPQSRERLLALGANGYLTKPFDVVEVVEKVDALLLSR